MSARGRRAGIFVELHVPDLTLAKRFYRRFGFETVREEPVRGGNGYLVLRRERSVLCFWGGAAVDRHAYFGRFRGSKRGHAVEIVVPVDDIDRAYRTARAARCVVEPLAARPWGPRDFRVEDPFGFYVRFTEPYRVTARWDHPRAARPPGSAPARRAPRRR